MCRHNAVFARFLHGLCFLTISVAQTLGSSLLRVSDRAVELVWTATTGEGQTGSNTIEAENGDVLTMTVYLRTAGDEGLICYGVSVLFDICLQRPPCPPHVLGTECVEIIRCPDVCDSYQREVGSALGAGQYRSRDLQPMRQPSIAEAPANAYVSAVVSTPIFAIK